MIDLDPGDFLAALVTDDDDEPIRMSVARVAIPKATGRVKLGYERRGRRWVCGAVGGAEVSEMVSIAQGLLTVSGSVCGVDTG